MRTYFRKILGVVILVGALSTQTTAQTAPNLPTNKEWTQEFQPFRIAGNLYYVGSYDLGCYLITTPQGHILINTGTVGSAPMIQSHVEKLGFKFSDIKILLTNQVHFDHVGGMAEIKKTTHAKMMVDKADASVLADGGSSDFVMGGKGAMFEPVKADRLLQDHDTIRLGGMQIVSLHHPGHTKGSCSFLFDVKDERRTYRVLIVNMPTILDETKLPGMRGYPNVGKDYKYTLEELPRLQFDLWLCPHASQFELHKKYQPGDGYHPEVFMERKGYDAEVEELKKAYLKKLNGK